MKRETVFVGLSGGVDSSVAALRLKKLGHEVVGVFIKVWQPDFLDCNWEAERLDAMRVAAHLDIPFRTFDAEETYKREVADYMIAEYKAGRTPNPDVMCNKHVKFGAFLDFAKANGADKVATGHYAQIEAKDDTYFLKRGIDESKDQSYFLWALSSAQRANIYFPVGDSTKDVIRREAEAAGLPTATKADSQGICFLGHVDIKEFLSHFTKAEKGDVLDTENNVIGQHDGALFFTLGQRHGFIIYAEGAKTEPHYVIAKDLSNNTLTVSTTGAKAVDVNIRISSTNKIEDDWSGTLLAQFRYRQKPFPVRIEEEEPGHAKLNVLEAVERPSQGQSCVLYRDEYCVGGGIIET